MSFTLTNGWGYQGDKMKLPVADVEAAIPFYQSLFAFRIESNNDSPFKSVVLERDGVRIQLNENGGDPTQDGCFFEVDNVDSAFDELKSRGLNKEVGDAMSIESHGDIRWKVFYVVAPDGLCYCIGQRVL
jgi:lactoylglutathione lyase